jgi:hypothetical protein
MTRAINLHKLGILGIVLIFECAVAAKPAFANWFDGSSLHLAQGHKLREGSAATPTPDDLCAIGDSNADHCYTDATRQVRRDYVLNERTGHYHEYRTGLDDKTVKDQATKPTGIR